MHYRLAKKKWQAELNQKREATQRLEGDIQSIKKENSLEMAQVIEQHEKDMAEVGEQFKAKLIVEYQKYDNLDEQYNALKVRSFHNKT